MNEKAGAGGTWAFHRVKTATGSVYTVGLFGEQFGVLRGYSTELSRSVESADSKPVLDSGDLLSAVTPARWQGRQLCFGAIQTASIVEVQPESEDRLIQKILDKYDPGPGPAVQDKDDAPEPTTDPGPEWLTKLPEGGIRRVFEQIATHGVVTETEAADMLGGPRALRKFSRSFETYADCAPFDVLIQVVGGVKRYTRGEGEA